MGQLFAALTHAIDGTPAVAIAASFIWGILSIVLSPCHLTSIPLVVGYISSEGRVTFRRTLGVATVFALGILASIAGIGALTAAAGRIAGDIGRWGNYAVAGVFFIVGLYLLDVIKIPFAGTGVFTPGKRSAFVAFMLGLVFGAAVGPCTFAYMAPVLAVVFKAAAAQPVYAGTLVLAYGVGHCAVIVLAGTFTHVVSRYLAWSEESKRLTIFKRICGVLVLLGGLYMLYKA